MDSGKNDQKPVSGAPLSPLQKIVDALNERQREAVTAPSQSEMILAGAGSGKTKALTARIAWIIGQGWARPSGILAVTFTNKAAKEMLERLEGMGISPRGMWVGTFHGISARILRRFHKEAGLPSAFQILDVDDAKSMLKRIYKEQSWSEELLPPKDALNFILSQKEQGIRAAQTHAKGAKDMRLREAYEVYEGRLAKEGSVDFPELILKTVELLEGSELIRGWAQEQFSHILIDEFQDTNRLQYRWMKLIAGDEPNPVFAVGDDDQCLAAGTMVEMADGSKKAIEQIKAGDWVRSCFGAAGFKPAKVNEVFKREKAKTLVSIKTRSGKTIVSTPEHTHFAGFENVKKTDGEWRLGARLCAKSNDGSVAHQGRASGASKIKAQALALAGFHVSQETESNQWIAKTDHQNFGELVREVRKMEDILGVKAELALRLPNQQKQECLPFTMAKDAAQGMRMLGADGAMEIIVSVEAINNPADVYDLNVFPSHNFCANGIVTHNSIYGFRKAEVENMRRFMRDFKIEEPIRLEQNYRSKGNILKAANELISQNTGRLGKNLWTSAEEGRKVHFKECHSESDEARFVAHEALQARQDGEDISQIAALYRTNAQSRALEHAMFQTGVPYRVYGGLRFFERAEIKNAIAFLRLAQNPQDDSAFLRACGFPTRGIGAKTLEKIALDAKARNIPMSQSAAERIAQGLEKGKAADGMKQLLDLADHLRSLSQNGAKLEELIRETLEGSGVMSAYQGEKDAQERVENLKELITAGRAFETEQAGFGQPTGLSDFLAHASLEAGERGAKDGEKAVQLMTVHSAKGLEFKRVFVCGLEEGVFPHANSLHDAKALEEERRLMYVAMTRAKEELTLLRSRNRNLYGQSSANGESRFLEELPEDAIFRLSPDPDRSWNQGSGYGGGSNYGGSSHGSRPQPGRGGSSSRSSGSSRDDFNYSQEGDGQNFKSQREGLWAVGTRVEHPVFGEGMIKAKSGFGDDLTLEIDFGREKGKRRLMAKAAKLTALGSPGKAKP